MKKLTIFSLLFVALATTVNAQRNNYDTYSYDDSYRSNRYFYDEDFDWHWDVRVRISNGIQNGLITRMEANRLYNRLEKVERQEYVYLQDGYFDNWEQEEIWNEVTWLNRQVGIELYDNDRRFYGFSLQGMAFRGYPTWYYNGGYDFNRFDRRGFGSIQLGYAPRQYRPQNNHYSYNKNNRGSYNNNRNWNNNDHRNDGGNWNKNNRNEGGNWNKNNNRNEGHGNERSASPQRNEGRSNGNRPNGSFDNKTSSSRGSSENARSRQSEVEKPMMPQRSAGNSASPQRSTSRTERTTTAPASPQKSSRGSIDTKSPNDFSRSKGRNQ